MKIIERGKYDKKFKCEECGCVFMAGFNEYKLSNPDDELYFAHQMMRFTANTKCPSCGSHVDDFVFLGKKDIDKLIEISSHVRRIIDEYYNQH